VLLFTTRNQTPRNVEAAGKVQVSPVPSKNTTLVVEADSVWDVK
jgi:hypothetical protein